MKKSNDIQRLASIWLTTLLVILSACSDDYPERKGSNKETATVTIRLNVPGKMSSATKAMSQAQESAIDDTKLQILVFEETGSTEVFRYQPEIINRNLPQVTFEVPTSSGNEKYRFVVLANAGPQSIASGTPKEEALQMYLFNTLGKWNASADHPSYIPMWGELSQPVVIKDDMQVDILLHRALARVDLGLLFKFNNPDPDSGEEYPEANTDKESVYGLDNFKIKEVRVYRTRSRGYVASSASLMNGNEVVAPSIPATAYFNSNSGTELTTLAEADQDPLLYILPAAADSYIREIYIPESAVIDAQSDKDNVPCLVIGGYYGTDNTTKITYYRADFADYSNGTVTAYFPILRNHQYVFDIKTVSGPGFEEPEQALNSITAHMQLNVVEWNLVPLVSYSQGHYFLSVQEREIWMEARAQANQPVNSYTVPFQTNLELDGSEGKRLDHLWQSTGSEESSYFDISIDYDNKTITFTTKTDNVNTGEGERTDVVILTTENFEVEIIVHQKAFNLNYNLSCDDVKVHGRYREGIPLNYANHISVKVITRGSDLHGGAYELTTPEKNGISFEGKGLFNNAEATALGGGDYEYTLILEGRGTPVNETGEDVFAPFEVTIITNSINNDFCTARIIMGYNTKRILTIGANATYRYGYMLEPNTGSRAFVDASVNFGVDPNSTVTVEENQFGNAFTIEVITAGSGMVGERLDYNYLKDKLNTFKPDIILTGQAINYNNAIGGDAIQLLSDFVNAGGVFLMFNEYYPVAASIQAMVQAIMGTGVTGNNQSIGYNQLFTIDGAEDDPLANGPFGDMRGNQWGADGHEMHGFTGLPAGTYIYSSRTDGYANMFRHASKGFVFVGDGGFISNPQRYIGGAYQGSYVYCPFAIDANYRPIPRTNFGLTPSGSRLNATVYNSQLFGNILTWAVDYAEMHGIDYPETGNKFN